MEHKVSSTYTSLALLTKAVYECWYGNFGSQYDYVIGFVFAACLSVMISLCNHNKARLSSGILGTVGWAARGVSAYLFGDLLAYHEVYPSAVGVVLSGFSAVRSYLRIRRLREQASAPIQKVKLNFVV